MCTGGVHVKACSAYAARRAVCPRALVLAALLLLVVVCLSAGTAYARTADGGQVRAARLSHDVDTSGGGLWRASDSAAGLGQWTLLTPPWNDDLLIDVTFIDATHGWAIRNAGWGSSTGTYLVATTDGGLSWRAVWQWTAPGGQADAVYLFTVAFASSQRGYAWGVRYAPGRVPFAIATTDGGLTWSEQTFERTDTFVEGVVFADSHHGFAVGQREGKNGTLHLALATDDGGVSWSETAGVVGSVIDCANASRAWAWTWDQPGIATTSDGGATWQNMGADLSRVAFCDTQHAIGYRQSGDVVTTQDGGVGWLLGGHLEVQVQDLALPDRTHGWATSKDGRIFATTDGGMTWSEEQHWTSAPLVLEFPDVNHGWAAGSVNSGTDGASSWSPVVLSITNHFPLDSKPESKAAITLRVSGLRNGWASLGKPLTILGAVTPANSGVKAVLVVVQARLGSAWLRAKAVSVKLGAKGEYLWKYTPPGGGSYRVRASTAAADAVSTASTTWVAFKVK